MRRRKDQAQVGFHINPKTGVWLGQPNENEAQNNPERIVQLIVPLVEDRKNALLIRFNERWVADLGEDEEKTLTTVQHALARGIEAVFQLEEGEILVEPTPSRKNRKALLFYEAAEGGAGALGQLISEPESLAKVAQKALEIMHFDPSTFASAAADVTRLGEQKHVDCVAGCYRCVLSYFNQPDHENIDRRNVDAQKMLLRLAYSATSPKDGPSGAPPSDGNANETDVTSAVADEFLEFPKMHPTPLKILEMELPLFWRSKRTVAIEEGDLTDELKAALEAKGVNYFVLPSHPEDRKRTLGELKKALET